MFIFLTTKYILLERTIAAAMLFKLGMESAIVGD